MTIFCYKCSKAATANISGKNYCSLHALEAQAEAFPAMLKKSELQRILGSKS